MSEESHGNPAASAARSAIERGPAERARRVRSALGEPRFTELKALVDNLRAAGRLPARLLFTVTPGRSGTGALAHILGGFRGMTATHEPRPSFGEALRAANQTPGVALEFWARRKLPAIAPARTDCYAETSHMACLGFLEELELLDVPFELVLLTRPARAVALSLWRLDTIPGRTLRGHHYYLTPRDRTLLRLPPTCLDALHDYQLCFWYAREVEARQAGWATPSSPVHHLQAGELEHPDVMRLVGERLGLGERRFGADLFFERRALRHRNQKRAKKLPRSLSDADLTRLEHEVRALWQEDSPTGGALTVTRAEPNQHQPPR